MKHKPTQPRQQKPVRPKIACPANCGFIGRTGEAFDNHMITRGDDDRHKHITLEEVAAIINKF